jgi:hypothetical protein
VPIKVVKPWRFGSDYCDTWKMEREAIGQEVVSSKLVNHCETAAQRLLTPIDDDDTIKRWFDASDKQVLITGEWRDEGTGLIIPVSCLMDFVPRSDSEFGSCLGDLKCVRSAHPIMFQRQAFKFGWHVQAGWCMDMYINATKEDRNTWCFILQENFEPWEPNRCMFGQEGDMGQPGFVELGRSKEFGYEGILSNYCKCLKSNKWPGYNIGDETVQGWCVLRPEPFQIERAMFGPKFDFDEPQEQPEPKETTLDDVIP